MRATIGLARLIRARQPRLFAHALAHRTKAAVAPLLAPADPPGSGEPVLLVSGTVPAARHHLALIVPIARHPENPNAVIVYDLARDPGPLATLDAEAIAARVFARGLAADDPERIGLRTVALNKCPVLAPLAALREADAERLGIDVAARLRHRDALAALLGADAAASSPAPGAVLGRIRAAMARPFAGEPLPDVDASLYAGGFLSTGDRTRLERLRAADPASLAREGGRFEDPRLDEMLFRYRARNHPDTLDPGERARWKAHVRARLGAGPEAPWLGRRGFDEAMRAQPWREDEGALREGLRRYADERLAAADADADGSTDGRPDRTVALPAS